MDYLPRIIDNILDELLESIAAVALEGPKGVGKTETAKRRANTTLELDDPEQVSILGADLSRLLSLPTPVLIDEWQRLPATWDVVRRAVDSDHSANRFVLTGSASPRNPPTHSGAGRIVGLRMRPLTLCEIRCLLIRALALIFTCAQNQPQQRDSDNRVVAPWPATRAAT